MAYTTETRERALELISETGSVTRAATVLGIPRLTLYRWRWDDQDFAAAWDMALDAHRDGLRERVEETVEAIGLGRWREVTSVRGVGTEQRLDTSHVDVRLLMKLMDKTMRDEVRALEQRTAFTGSVEHSQSGPVTIEVRNPDGSIFEVADDA